MPFIQIEQIAINYGTLSNDVKLPELDRKCALISQISVLKYGVNDLI